MHCAEKSCWASVEERVLFLKAWRNFLRKRVGQVAVRHKRAIARAVLMPHRGFCFQAARTRVTIDAG